MHDRLKRTARKRGNRLRAKPIIEAHMARGAERQAEQREKQRAERAWLSGWRAATEDDRRRMAEEAINRARTLIPATGDLRDDFRLSGPVDETVTSEHAGYGRLAEALTYDYAGRRQALTAWQAARREQRRTSGMDPADPG